MVAVDVDAELGRLSGANRAALEEQARAATIKHLVAAVEEQRRRLNTQMVEALDVLAQAGRSQLQAAREPELSPAISRPTVRCLGSLSVSVGTNEITRWRSGKARALFEYLVTHHDRIIPREALTDVLWPDPEGSGSGVSLKVAVHTLRQVLAVFNEHDSAPLTIQAHEAGYQLVAPGLWLDVDEFERCCSLAARLHASNRLQDALTFYAYACDLYGGDFLSDSIEDWAVFRRESLKDQYLVALAQLADAALVVGDYRACIHRCRELLEQDRSREDTFRTLMICHARLGQPGRVRRWYELCVQVLRTELDVEPAAETLRVYARALRGD